MQFIWPLDDYIITRGFYYLASLYVGGQHAALDLIRRLAATRAAPIRAVADGTVVGVGWDYYSGFFVAVAHAGGFRSFYRHLYGQTPVVVGQQVGQGQIIGNVGNTGWSQGDHLHFDLWNRNKVRDDNAIFYKNGWYAVDPALYLGQEDKDMPLTAEERKELDTLKEWQREHANIVRDNDVPGTPAYLLSGGVHYPIIPAAWEASGRDDAAVIGVPHDTIMQRAPIRGTRNATAEEVRRGSVTPASGGVTEERVKALIRAAKLTV